MLEGAVKDTGSSMPPRRSAWVIICTSIAAWACAYWHPVKAKCRAPVARTGEVDEDCSER